MLTAHLLLGDVYLQATKAINNLCSY